MALHSRKSGTVAIVERSELGPVKVPLAVHACRFLELLKPGAQMQECLAQIRSLLAVPAQVSRARRLALLVGVLAFPVMATMVSGWAHALTVSAFQASPELATLRECLAQHRKLETQAASGPSAQTTDREAFEIYIVGRFAPVISNPTQWNKFFTRIAITDALRSDAERILASRPTPTPDQFADAATKVERFFKRLPDLAARQAISQVTLPMLVLIFCYASTVVLFVVPCLMASLLFRGGALIKLVLGIVVVNRTGARASRWRVAWRNLIAWLPFLLLPANVMGPTPGLGLNGAMLLMVGLTLGLALISALLPQRAWQTGSQEPGSCRDEFALRGHVN